MRAALHAHILCWFKARKKKDEYKAVDPVKRTAPGSEPRQRPLGQTVEPLTEKQADHVYQVAHVGPITGEMVRPNVSGEKWGGIHSRDVEDRGPCQSDSDPFAISSLLYAPVLFEGSLSLSILFPMALPTSSMLLREH